jgi:HJR/Mrr/RecB family endonuclease
MPMTFFWLLNSLTREQFKKMQPPIVQINLWEILKNSWPIIWKFWPLWLIFLIFGAIQLFFEWLDLEIDNWQIHRKFKKGEQWRSDRDLLLWLRGMHPSEFEDYIAGLFSRMGYKTRAVGQSHDGGVDVIAEKSGIINYIQCKKFITSEVTVGDVRDFYGSLADHLANGQGYFITTNKFTLEARKFAEDKPIELIDGFGLIRYIRMTKKDDTAQTSRKCPRCGGAVVERTGKFGAFYGCSNYPKCKYT